MQQKVPSYQLACGAVLLAIAVTAGAFGSHVLDSFAPRTLLPIWHTAVLYQLIHGAGILGIVAGRQYIIQRWQNLGFSALFIGSVFFSGSLYLFVFTQQGWLTMLTPVGGILMVLGWIIIAVGAIQKGRQSNT
ncbi:MAG TPA: DUF423 domain-containing protein [Paenalcaligenes sp.]|nr:DUF423 domain-containing protein [Paenalcaligenes sp.]